VDSLPRILVTGTFVGSSGPLLGRVVFDPSFDVLVDPAGNVIHDGAAASYQLDATGSFAVSLLPTDLPGVSPPGWVWTVTEPTGRRYSFALPAATSGGVAHLAGLSAVPIPGPEVAVSRRIQDASDYDATVAPTAGQVLAWDGTSKYKPATVAGSGGLDAEAARDVIGAALVGGSNITITVNDPADTITVGVTGLSAVARSGAYTDLTGTPLSGIAAAIVFGG
jgi:hypothetical protein